MGEWGGGGGGGGGGVVGTWCALDTYSTVIARMQPIYIHMDLGS